MAFALLTLTLFIMFFQPTDVFPELLPYAPLKYTALAALLIYIISGGEGDEQRNFLSNSTNRYFVLFILIQIVSASRLWFMHGYEIFNFWLRYGIVFYLIVKTATTVKRLKWLTLSVVAGIAYLSYFSITEFVLKYLPGMRAGGFGWYENSNDLAVILVSIIPLSYLLFEISSGIVNKIIYLVITSGFAINILFTGSRNGLLGLFTVGSLSLIISNISKPLRLGLMTLLCASIIGVGLNTVLSRSDLTELSGDGSSEGRIEQWIACMRMIKSHPLLGVGPDNSTEEMKNYGGIRGLPPHNTIIQVFAETGIFGGFLFLLFGIKPTIDFLKNHKQALLEKNTEIILYKYYNISLMGFWICAFFTNRVKGYQLYVLIALIVATLNLKNSNMESIISRDL